MSMFSDGAALFAAQAAPQQAAERNAQAQIQEMQQAQLFDVAVQDARVEGQGEGVGGGRGNDLGDATVDPSEGRLFASESAFETARADAPGRMDAPMKSMEGLFRPFETLDQQLSGSLDGAMTMQKTGDPRIDAMNDLVKKSVDFASDKLSLHLTMSMAGGIQKGVKNTLDQLLRG